MSLNSTILSVTRRTVKGFTVGEIFTRVSARLTKAGKTVPAYSTVRARVYELELANKLFANNTRADSVSGRKSLTFIRDNSFN